VFVKTRFREIVGKCEFKPEMISDFYLVKKMGVDSVSENISNLQFLAKKT
jgi:hypothetical protein